MVIIIIVILLLLLVIVIIIVVIIAIIIIVTIIIIVLLLLLTIITVINNSVPITVTKKNSIAQLIGELRQLRDPVLPDLTTVALVAPSKVDVSAAEALPVAFLHHHPPLGAVDSPFASPCIAAGTATRALPHLILRDRALQLHAAAIEDMLGLEAVVNRGVIPANGETNNAHIISGD